MKKNIFYKTTLLPLLRKHICITKAKIPSLENLTGQVVLETANTFHILTKKSVKIVLKASVEEITIFEKTQTLKVNMYYFQNTGKYRIKNLK